MKAEANRCVLSCFLKVWKVEHDVTESGKEFQMEYVKKLLTCAHKVLVFLQQQYRAEPVCTSAGSRRLRPPAESRRPTSELAVYSREFIGGQVFIVFLSHSIHAYKIITL